MSLTAKLDREEIRIGIEPNQQLAALSLDCVSEPIGEERNGWFHADSEILRHVLSLQAESAGFLTL
jgi:hypothetical protein